MHEKNDDMNRASILKLQMEVCILSLVILSACGQASPATPIPATPTPLPVRPTFTSVPTATETPIPSPTPLPLPVTISVPANAGWVGTGLILPLEQPMLITSEGLVDYVDDDGLDPNAADSDSDGDGSSCDKATIERIINQKLTLDCLLTGVSWGALVGRVGENGTPFLIGSKYQLTADTSGELFLGVNDCCNFADNSGEFKVTIEPTPTEVVKQSPGYSIGGGSGKLIFDYSSFEYENNFADIKGEINVFMANVDGTNLTPVTNLDGFNSLLDISPDGTKALVVSAPEWRNTRGKLYVVNLESLASKPFQLADGVPYEGFFNFSSAKWLDDTSLMYIGQGEKGFGIYKVNSDGTNSVVIERNTASEILAVNQERVYWSMHIEKPYLNGTTSRFDVWYTNLDGSETAQLEYKGEKISVMYNKNAVAISPDGTKIAWVDVATPADPQDYKDYLRIASLSDIDNALVLETGPRQIKWRLDGKSILAFGDGLFEVSAESATVIKNFRLGDNILGRIGSTPLQCSDISLDDQLLPCLTFEVGRNADGHTPAELILVNLETASYTEASGMKFFFLTWTPRTMIWLR